MLNMDYDKVLFGNLFDVQENQDSLCQCQGSSRASPIPVSILSKLGKSARII
jgi:hypothetical protein